MGPHKASTFLSLRLHVCVSGLAGLQPACPGLQSALRGAGTCVSVYCGVLGGRCCQLSLGGLPQIKAFWPPILWEPATRSPGLGASRRGPWSHATY